MKYHKPRSTIAAVIVALLLGCLSVISIKPWVFAQKPSDSGKDYLQRWPNRQRVYARDRAILRVTSLNQKCQWYYEQTFVFPAKLSDEDSKALNKLLDKLVDALGAAESEVSAIKKGIDKLGPAGDVVEVVIVYACEDEDGNIHRKKYKCDDTENIYWAAKMNLATGAAAKDRDQARETIVKKHKPQGSCCKAETKASVGYKVGTTPSPGLNTQVITTPNGKLIVNVPGELYGGDTFTGTVFAEPAGKTEAERSHNQNQLNGMVLDIGQQKTRVSEKFFTRTIPANLTREAQALILIVGGKEAVNAPISISDAPPW